MAPRGTQKIKILHQSIVLSGEFKQLTKFIKYLTRFHPVFWDRSSFFVISLIGAPYNAKRSFPRELNRRNRRRIYCSRCGNSYCPKCKNLYDYKDCIQNRCGRQVSARCKFVPWSRHPRRNRRGKKLLSSQFILCACDVFLLKLINYSEVIGQ